MMVTTTYSILVVDDEENNRDILARRLIRDGFAVTTAINGANAIKTLERERFDLILLDFMMPEMDGLQVLQQIKRNSSCANTPVFMCTAVGDKETVVRCIQAGATDYLLKPIDYHAAMTRINRCLAQRDRGNLTKGEQPGIAAGIAARITKDARILIAEDDLYTQQLIERRMTQLGCKVTMANDGEATVKTLESHEFDLILLDIMLPDINGIELLRKLRDEPRLNDTPILMISALDDSDTMTKCYELGAQDYIRKPFRADILRSHIMACLEAGKKKRRNNEDAKEAGQA
jgi:DNA-binding response OmpR family regulator